MYNYEWDIETGGYTLSAKIIGVIKEVRPVFKEELSLLGFDEQFGWIIPESNDPLMWAEARKYIYKGICVGEAIGGNLFELPKLKANIQGLKIEPVNVVKMIEKNKMLLDGLIQKTLKYIYETYKEYQNRMDMFYVAFSGGKDSIVLLDLVQRSLPHDGFVVVFGNTTMEFLETYKTFEWAKNKWNSLEWFEAKSHLNAEESWSTIGYPSRKLRWCCSVHKTAPSILKIIEIIDEKLRIEGRKPKNLKVMVFDGIRAEESDTRASYSMISEGRKHLVQSNCSPIFKWNTCELFVYMMENELFVNKLYKLGATRVGCKLCPMASSWYESILNHSYQDEIKPLLSIIEKSLKKDFHSETDKKQYFQNGGWKSRVGGRELDIGENKIMEILTDDGFQKFVIQNSNYDWKKWMPAIGNLFEFSENKYTIDYKDITQRFKVIENTTETVLILEPLFKTKSYIRFIHLFKNALYKAAYCINCKACMVECSSGALYISDNDIKIKGCKHCEACLDSPKGCLVARSLGITGGGKNMSNKNINRYQNFGFRKEWLKIFFELGDSFWTNERMGKYMLIGFRTWLRESGITENNAITKIGKKLSKIENEDIKVWSIIFINLAYESPIINWYVKNIEFYREYQNNDLIILLGDDYSETTKKNALSSLKETLRFSPIGLILEQGAVKMKGKAVVSITRNSWINPEPLAILYCLYMYAEKSEGFYSFRLTDLYDIFEKSKGLNPKELFNIEKEKLKQILIVLSNDYNEYIKVSFNKDLENINLNREKKSADIVDLF